jgi:hypothetical protein
MPDAVSSTLMLPLRIVETDRPDFEQPIVELWREGDFVGMVFWDGEEAVVQIYPDDSGDVFDIGVEDMFRVLELATQIVMPEDQLEAQGDAFLAEINATAPEGSWDEEDPFTRTLTEEFDDQVVYRAEDGEGFFDRETALALLARCDQLGLAVVTMDGFDLEGAVLIPRPELSVAIAAPQGLDWGIRVAAANAQIREALEGWDTRPTLVATFVIQQSDGETFIA